MRDGITSQVSLGSQLPLAQGGSLNIMCVNCYCTVFRGCKMGAPGGRRDLDGAPVASIPHLPPESTTGAWLQAKKSLTSVGKRRTDWKPQRAD